MTTKCYVGTYGKYNNGSLEGAWLDLSKYENYEAFIAACKETHKNESDPEYMIQDWDNLPDGFSGVEWISESDFNDLKEAMQEEEKANLQIVDYSEKAIALVGDTKTIKEQLKKLGGRFNPKLSCGAGWIFPKSKLAEVQKFVDCGEITKGERVQKTQRDEALWAEFKQRLEKADADVDYYLKNASNLLRMDSGIILIFEKERIKTEFCWHDEGPQYEEFKRVHATQKALQEYFLQENLEKYDTLIKNLQTRKDRYGSVLVPVYYETIYYRTGKTGFGREMYLSPEYYVQNNESDPRTRDSIHRMSESEAKKVLAILKDERAKFEKRLNAYLKRYGTSKLHTWTYWADR